MMHKFFKQKNRAFTRTPKFGVTPKGGGFTLVETLVAISIFTMSVLALMSVMASGLSNTSYAKQKVIAGYLAQEGIEYIRNMRDTYVLYGDTWTNFKSKFTSCSSVNPGCGFIKPKLPFNVFTCSNSSPDTCELYLKDGVYATDIVGGADSGFIRRVWMDTTLGSDEVKIYSAVSWKQGSGTYNITLSEDLFNWFQ